MNIFIWLAVFVPLCSLFELLVRKHYTARAARRGIIRPDRYEHRLSCLLMSLLIAVSFTPIFVLAWPGPGMVVALVSLLIALGASVVFLRDAHNCESTPVCAKCKYEFGYPLESRQNGEAPERCSECGAEWINRLRWQKRPPRKTAIALGGMLAVLSTVFLMFGLISPSRAIISIWPTTFLLTWGEEHRYHDDVWEELASRAKADPAAARAMASQVALIASRERLPYKCELPSILLEQGAFQNDEMRAMFGPLFEYELASLGKTYPVERPLALVLHAPKGRPQSYSENAVFEIWDIVVRTDAGDVSTMPARHSGDPSITLRLLTDQPFESRFADETVEITIEFNVHFYRMASEATEARQALVARTDGSETESVGMAVQPVFSIPHTLTQRVKLISTNANSTGTTRTQTTPPPDR